MKKGLLLLVIMSVLLMSCVSIGSAAPAGKAPGKAPDVTGGMAQTPGELQSLPGAQPGSAPISQSGSSGRQPSTSGSGMGELQGLQGGNQPSGMGELQGLQGGNQPSGMGELQAGGQGGGPGGELPVIQSGSTGTMSGFKAPPPASLSMPAGVPVEKLPFFEKNLYADTVLIEVREPVFLGWKVVRADSYSLDLGGGKIVTVPKERTGYFVVPEIPGNYTYTLTATNAYGAVSQKVDVVALSAGQRPAFTRGDRCRTFLVYPQQIKKGQSVFVYWNVLDADYTYLESYLINTLLGKPDPRDQMTSSGTEEFWPPESTTFRLTFLNGAFPDKRNVINDDYWWKEYFVDVR